MRALLDITVLLAMLDEDHVHHSRARAWWAENRDHGWASCPLTQNGYVRIVSGPGYTNPIHIADGFATLSRQLTAFGHEFWPADISLLDSESFNHSRILGPKQITDVYLLALAVKNDGRFVTLDRGIPLAVVRGAEARHLVVI